MKGRLLSFALFFTAHSVSATAFAFVFAFLFGGLSPLIAGISLTISFVRAGRFIRVMQNTLEWRAPETSRKWSTAELAIFIFSLFAAWKHFAWLMPMMPLTGGAGVATLSTTNYGDLPLHINFIRALANGLEFLPKNPIFALEPLRYPFGPDLYNALWESLGIQTTAHLFLTGMIATFTALVLLREIGGAWAMAAFFLAGGSVAIEGPNIVEWKSFFLAIWITQRGMLWALPIGLTLILFLRPHLAGTTRLPRRAVSGLGRMWGVFPLFHAHSFVVVSLLLFLLIWRDFGISRTRAFFRRFFLENRAFVWAVVPATFLIHYTSAGFTKASIVHWRYLWMLPKEASSSETWIWLWNNFGLSVATLTVMLGVLAAASKIFFDGSDRPARSHRDELGILALFFIVFLFVMLAPWEWDNIKVLIWPWILVFALVGRSFIKLEQARPSVVWTALTWIGIACAFAPGGVVIAQSWSRPQLRSTVLWSVEELAYAESVLMRVSKNAVFAAAPTPTHVLPYFGRVRALGYPGHLWSHAIRYTEAETDLENLMTGTEGWVEAAKRLKVTHIYWGPEERERWGREAPPPWLATLPLAAKAGGHEVYEFKEAR